MTIAYERPYPGWRKTFYAKAHSQLDWYAGI